MRHPSRSTAHATILSSPVRGGSSGRGLHDREAWHGRCSASSPMAMERVDVALPGTGAPTRPARAGGRTLVQALLLFALFQVLALFDEHASVPQRLREIVHWGAAEILVLELWRRGLARWLDPAKNIAFLEALKLACERQASLLGQVEASAAVVALTLGQLALLGLCGAGQWLERPRLHRLLTQVAFGVPLVLAGTLLIESYVTLVVRQ